MARALLNTADENVAGEYIDRAVNCAPGILKIPSHAVFGEGPEALDEFFAQLEHEIIEDVQAAATQFCQRQLRHLAQQISLPAAGGDIRPVFTAQQLAALLDRLADRFPGISMLILDGNAERTPDDIATLRASVIEPPPDAEAETNAEYYRGELELFAGGDRAPQH